MKNYKTFRTVPLLENMVAFFGNDFSYKIPDQKKQSMYINHIIGTKYCNNNDNIGFHDDKVNDLAKDSLILILSFGERREMHLKDNLTGDLVCFVMEPGSLFILGPITNKTMRHSLVKVEHEKLLNRKNAPVGVRMSLVFRHVTTIFDRDLIFQKIQKTAIQKEKRKAEKIQKTAIQKEKRKEEKIQKTAIQKEKRKADKIERQTKEESPLKKKKL